jgi:D-beta-D-heptose 7-phosphate kinase/D-beta-D-heptose 1-phosphate adenosyltransferase
MITVVAISGGFDPIHIGHLRSIKEAKKLGDKLMVILTRDEQLIQKKGYYFMPYEERKEILESVEGVDRVVPNIDAQITSNESLEYYRPDIFAKGGDRTEDNMPEIEKMICEKIGCKIVYGVGGDKIQSSSSLVKRSSRLRGEVPASAG